MIKPTGVSFLGSNLLVWLQLKIRDYVFNCICKIIQSPVHGRQREKFVKCLRNFDRVLRGLMRGLISQLALQLIGLGKTSSCRAHQNACSSAFA